MALLSWIIILTSAVLCALCVMLLIPFLLETAESAERVVQIRSIITAGEKNNKVQEKSNLGELLLADLCTNGFSLMRLPARLFLQLPSLERACASTAQVLSHRFAGCNKRAVSEALLLLALACGTLVFVFTQQLLLALTALFLPFVIAQTQAQKWLKERRNKLRDQLPDAFKGLGMCFMAGLSLEQAFDQTSKEIKDPLQRELQYAVDELRTGSSISEALANLDSRLAMSEMKYVLVALEIQHQTGGSMREVLDAAADSMLASFDLSRSLEVQTAQARMSARVVSIMPLALVLVLSLAMEGYLATFFSSPTGFFLLVTAVVMELAGIVIIRRILGIDLG